MERYSLAFAMSLVAGLSTGIGGLIAVFFGSGKKFLPVSLGFSAGVMIYVSFVELFKESQSILISQQGNLGELLTVLGFFIGIMVILLIDQILPEDINPHEVPNKDSNSNRLKRVGLLTALGIVIHNFPEGIATFTSALQDARLGLAITVAVAIHNIPEGIAVAVPIYRATNSPQKAIKYAFLSGLAEPAGALIGMMFLHRFMNETVFAMILAAVAGIMVFISIDELLPTAHEYGEHHLSVFGMIFGMAVMALTLLIV